MKANISKFPKEQFEAPIPTTPQEAITVLMAMKSGIEKTMASKSPTGQAAQAIALQMFKGTLGISADITQQLLDAKDAEKAMQTSAIDIAIAALAFVVEHEKQQIMVDKEILPEEYLDEFDCKEHHCILVESGLALKCVKCGLLQENVSVTRAMPDDMRDRFRESYSGQVICNHEWRTDTDIVKCHKCGKAQTMEDLDREHKLGPWDTN